MIFPHFLLYTEFARLDCVIISVVIRLTSVSGPTGIRPHRDKSEEPDLDYMKWPLEKNPRLINRKGELKILCYKLFFICVTLI